MSGLSGLRQGRSMEEAEIEQATTRRRGQTYNSRLSMVTNTVRRQAGSIYMHAGSIVANWPGQANSVQAWSPRVTIAVAAATEPLQFASSSASCIYMYDTYVRLYWGPKEHESIYKSAQNAVIVSTKTGTQKWLFPGRLECKGSESGAAKDGWRVLRLHTAAMADCDAIDSKNFMRCAGATWASVKAPKMIDWRPGSLMYMYLSLINPFFCASLSTAVYQILCSSVFFLVCSRTVSVWSAVGIIMSSVRPSVCLWHCALWLSGLVYRAKSCTSVFSVY